MDSTVKAKKVITKKKGKVRKFFGSFVNVKTWVAYDELVTNLGNTCGFFKSFFSRPQKEIRKESYEEAVARMALTEEQLQRRKDIFLKSAIVYFIFVLMLCGYATYLLVKLKFLVLLLVLILLIPTGLIACSEHFWYMQMEKKKLGCTFNEWLEFIFRRK